MAAKIPRYVLDSFALLALLEAEPGAGRVRDLLLRAADERAEIYMPLVNFGEVAYITEREQGLPAAQKMIAAVDQLPIRMVPIDRALAFGAAHLKARHAIAYADALAVALAQELGAILVTGDPELRKVEQEAQIEWLPGG